MKNKSNKSTPHPRPTPYETHQRAEQGLEHLEERHADAGVDRGVPQDAVQEGLEALALVGREERDARPAAQEDEEGAAACLGWNVMVVDIYKYVSEKVRAQLPVRPR